MVIHRPLVFAFFTVLGLALSSLFGLPASVLAQESIPVLPQQLPAQESVPIPQQQLPAQNSVPVPQQQFPSQPTRGICLVSPRDNASIFSTRPVLTWKGGAIQRIELTDLTQNEMAWSGDLELPVPQLAYRGTPLIPGHRYRWTGYGPSRAVLGTAEFAIMTEEQRAPIETALSTLRTQLAQQGKSPAEINVEVVNYLDSQGLEADAVITAVNAVPPAPALGRYVRTVRDRKCSS